MQEEKILTLHPDPNKTGKKISLSKYELVKKNMLAILSKKTLSHTELMEALHEKVKNTLDGNAQWYGETVKLDLEARKMITRTNDKPQRYMLVKK